MNARSFDAFTRRGSLAALGATGLAALAGTFTAAAKQSAAKKTRKKAKKKCKNQVGECITVFSSTCEGNSDCLANVQRCCPLIKTCDFSEFVSCALLD